MAAGLPAMPPSSSVMPDPSTGSGRHPYARRRWTPDQVDVCSLGIRIRPSLRHCERSEAIQSGLRYSGLLRCARNDGITGVSGTIADQVRGDDEGMTSKG